jgi:hypothetical protein
VTVYKVIAEPPLVAGADQFLVAAVLAGVATGARGAEGTVNGVTGVANTAGEEVPISFIATTSTV